MRWGYLVDENDAPCSIPAIGVGGEREVLLDVIRSVLIEDCEL